MRLLASHEIDEAHRLAGVARQRRRPDQARRPVAEEISCGHCRKIGDGWILTEKRRVAPTITGLIEIQANAIMREIDNIGGPGAVDVGQAHPLLIELFRRVEPRCIVHRHLSAKLSVTEAWPVAHFAVADTH